MGPDAVAVDSDDCELYGESETAEEEGEEGGDGDEDESTEESEDWSGSGDNS